MPKLENARGGEKASDRHARMLGRRLRPSNALLATKTKATIADEAVTKEAERARKKAARRPRSFNLPGSRTRTQNP